MPSPAGENWHLLSTHGAQALGRELHLGQPHGNDEAGVLPAPGNSGVYVWGGGVCDLMYSQRAAAPAHSQLHLTARPTCSAWTLPEAPSPPFPFTWSPTGLGLAGKVDDCLATWRFRGKAKPEPLY